MKSSPVGTYLRSHRKRSCLSQRELAEVLGVVTEWQVSLHEQSREIPLLITAISYEIIFRVPLPRLFPGVYETVQENIDCRLSELETRLRESTAKGRSATLIARKLEWISERRNIPSMLFDSME